MLCLVIGGSPVRRGRRTRVSSPGWRRCRCGSDGEEGSWNANNRFVYASREPRGRIKLTRDFPLRRRLVQPAAALWGSNLYLRRPEITELRAQISRRYPCSVDFNVSTVAGTLQLEEDERRCSVRAER